MWLMGDGANYDGEFKHGSLGGIVYWDFVPPDTVHQSFLDDFAMLLEICRAEKMRLIPVLLDFGFFNEPPRDGEGRYPTAASTFSRGTYARGRRSIAENPLFQNKFIKGTLEPLLKIAAAETEIIYAFDIINEPFWCVSRWPTGIFGRPVVKNDMIDFSVQCCKSIKDAGLKSTIGHRYLGDIHGEFSKVIVDHPQHHYYAHPPLLTVSWTPTRLHAPLRFSENLVR